MAGSADASLRSDLAHLYRRAAFGAHPDELDVAADAGYRATVDALLAGLDEPGATVVPPEMPNPKDAHPLVPWWVNLMATTSTPAREKLALFWHGHFATSDEKVRNGAFMAHQNDLFRHFGGGDFEDLAAAVAKDPAMLVWLDGNSNVKAHPNENLARELMELFTLGVGNYTEPDVKEAARCLTGWRAAPESVAATFAAARHDPGTKTVLGHTGNFGSDDLVHLIVETDTSARFIVAKLYSHYARPVSPTDPVVEDLTAAYGRSGRNITALLRAVFTHSDFLSAATRTGLVKTPVEWLVGTLRAVHAKAGSEVVNVLAALGQVPFYPPSVGGWGQNRYWLSTGANLVRLNSAYLLAGKADLSAITSAAASQRPAAAARLLGIDKWGSATSSALGQAADSPRLLFALATASPEFLLA